MKKLLLRLAICSLALIPATFLAIPTVFPTEMTIYKPDKCWNGYSIFRNDNTLFNIGPKPDGIIPEDVNSVVRNKYNPYEKQGIRRAINASGGSIIPPEVFKTMGDASKYSLNGSDLRNWAGKAIAEATGAEAGMPTAGACNAITLAAAACIMKGTELKNDTPLEEDALLNIIQKLPVRTEGLKTEFIVQKCNWTEYVHRLECAGGRIIWVGTDEGTTEEELDEAFDPEKTAGYFFTAVSSTGYLPRGDALPLETIIRIAHDHDVPVIVDASLTLPPKKNLRKFISQGADLVAFSGGKFIPGPSNSGMLAGRRTLIRLASLQATNDGIGRGSKISGGTILGLVTALNILLKQNEEALFDILESKSKWMAEQLNMIPGVEAGVVTYKYVFFTITIEEEERKSTIPQCYVKIDNEVFGLTESELSKKLGEGNPSISAPYHVRHGNLMINPVGLREGDESIILQRIREILNQARSARGCP